MRGTTKANVARMLQYSDKMLHSPMCQKNLKFETGLSQPPEPEWRS